MKAFYTLISLLVGCLFFSLIGYLGYGLSLESFNTKTIAETAQSPHLWGTIQKSCWIALFTATCATVIGALLAQVIRNSRLRNLLLAITVFQLLLSPYISTQGWIYWFGENGFLDLNLFSSGGLIFLLTLQNLPWVIVICSLVIQPAHSGQDDLASLLHWNRWKRFQLLHLPRFRLALSLSFLWVFFQAFWAYDTSSMLRQNMIALELMAAFGSFYDLNRALGVIVATSPILVLITILLGFTLKSCRQLNFRSLEHTVQPRFSLSSLLFLSLLLIFPIWGLMLQLPAREKLIETIISYQQDLWNTFYYSAFSAVIALIVCFTIPKPRVLHVMVAIALGLIFCIPSTIHGIIWTTTLNKVPLPFSETGAVILLLTFLLLPVGYALKWGLFDTTHSSVTDFLKLSPLRTRLLLLKDVDRPKLGLLLLFLMLLASREVPALLLTYPAGGSTLALTIETMLHFDQPELVSTLALMQMGFTLLLFFSVRLIFGKL